MMRGYLYFLYHISLSSFGNYHFVFRFLMVFILDMTKVLYNRKPCIKPTKSLTSFNQHSFALVFFSVYNKETKIVLYIHTRLFFGQRNK